MSEGRPVSSDARNTRVVVCLILAMTAGARVLLWLEPRPSYANAMRPLTAVDGQPIQSVQIEYVAADALPPASAGVIVLPDGRCHWDQLGPHVHVAVIGSSEAYLPMRQKAALLSLLQGISWGRGAGGQNVVPVRLSEQSDPRLVPTLPPAAHDLYQMLAAKQLLE